MAEGRSRIGPMLAVGAVTGLASGLLGVGGGFVMVPGMVYWLKTRQHEAHGTSLAVIIPVAAVGALILGKGHDVDPGTALLLAIGAVGGAVGGARLTRRISALRLRQAFGLVATVAGLIMI
ncbi:MAG TPA: sulfite exporter TauE/SafE family protein, partial [Candidatus Dormibacteraeota bacterium]|nr:sulfite exporter TauE/SafE family protein [Candidatus Dormibacteraeota bacterium]